ncbi:unnamed protein product [Dovyalis caffra]|uniref:Uncharacterized protein n=1 Tax=Dovyalis caffra TaxID=77055 RepID=A0AAV1RY97_9ROSI|nr:unnamed protein product [Dovyalis caffra]
MGAYEVAQAERSISLWWGELPWYVKGRGVLSWCVKGRGALAYGGRATVRRKALACGGQATVACERERNVSLARLGELLVVCEGLVSGEREGAYKVEFFCCRESTKFVKDGE